MHVDRSTGSPTSRERNKKNACARVTFGGTGALNLADGMFRPGDGDMKRKTREEKRPFF